MGLLTRSRQIHLCPMCGGELTRVHRHLADRMLGAFRSVHRYQCNNPACTWEGIVSDDLPLDANAAVGQTGAGWRSRALWFLVGAAVALASMQAARLYLKEKAAQETLRSRVAAANRLASESTMPVEIGESFDGELLAEDDPHKVDNASPLNLRRRCAWGIPGRNPYQGSVGQALTAARLPESAVRKFEALVEKKVVSDRLEITREHIATIGMRRQFDVHSFDMAFGNTMCFNSRVNFKPGHVEYADLYEATDSDGKRYAVMVPDACGNVAVLGDREERNGFITNGKTPEPATIAMFAGGLALLAWFARRRGRRA